MKKNEFSELLSNLLIAGSVSLAIMPLILGDQLVLIVGGLMQEGGVMIDQFHKNYVHYDWHWFWATGNGAATRGGVLGHPTIIDPRMTAPSIVMVGGHDSGYVNTWPDFPPHVVSDSCNCWGAYHQSLDESADTVGSGTSSATPFAAGGAARILQEARAIPLPREFDFGCPRETRAGCLRFGNLTDNVYLRGIHDTEQHGAGRHVCASRGISLGNHAGDRRANGEETLAIGCASPPCSVVLSQARFRCG